MFRSFYQRLLLKFASAYRPISESFFQPTVLVLYLVYGVFYLPRKADNIVKTSLEADGFSLEEIALCDTVYLFTYTVSILFAGMYGANYPANKLLATSCVCLAIINFLKAHVITARSFLMLQILHAMVQSTGWPTCIRVLSLWVTKDRGLIMGLWTTCQSMGGVLGGIIAAYFLSAFSRSASYLATIPMLLIVAFLAFRVIEDDRPDSTIDLEQQDQRGFKSAKPSEHLKHRRRASSDIIDLPKVKFGVLICKLGIIAVGIAYFFLKFVRYALLMWLPYYYQDGLHFDALTSGYMSTSFEMGGLFGTPLIGYISDQYVNGNVTKTAALFLSGAACMLFMCNVVSGYGVLMNEMTMFMVGILVIGPDSVISGTVISDLVRDNGLNPQDVSSVAGLINCMGSSGSIFQSGATAHISQHYGWSTLFLSFVFFSSLSSSILFATLFVRKPSFAKI